jgi:hypothetical protein
MYSGFCLGIEEKSAGRWDGVHQGAHRKRNGLRQERSLGRAAKNDAWQMATASDKGDRKLQADTRLAFEENLRSCAGRTSRPRRSWLETGGTAGRSAPIVNFVRSGARQGVVRAILVVPALEESQFALEGRAEQRHHWQQAGATLLERADEAFTDCDASGLADGASAMADGMTAAPGFEADASELRADVSDEILGTRGDLGPHTAEELTDLLGGGLFSEHGWVAYPERVWLRLECSRTFAPTSGTID